MFLGSVAEDAAEVCADVLMSKNIKCEQASVEGYPSINFDLEKGGGILNNGCRDDGLGGRRDVQLAEKIPVKLRVMSWCPRDLLGEGER